MVLRTAGFVRRQSASQLKMHVCHFCETSVDTEYFRNVVRGLTERGVKVSLVELGPNDPPKWLAKIAGVKYFNLGVTQKWQFPLAAIRLGRLLRGEGVDILHTHLFYAGLISISARPIARRTTVALMRHHTDVVRMLGSRIHVVLDRWMAERADRLITVSEAAKRYMIDMDHITRHIDVVHLGFNFKIFTPDHEARLKAREKFGFAPDDVVIGYVGNFAPGKGHAQLVEAFKRVQDYELSVKLLFVGGGDCSEILAVIKKHNVTDHVALAGRRNDVAACLNAMDIFVQPSLSEAFSQVLIEAMAVGLPVVATDVGGAKEVVESEKNGILMAPNDIDAIIQNILRLARNPGLRASLGSTGMRDVRDRFTVDRMVDKQFALYRHWLRDKHRGS